MIRQLMKSSDRRRQTRGKRAFTLLELFVVIVIITLLVSMLLPAVGKARSIAMGIVCEANLKQLQIGWQMFLEENHQSIPYTKHLGHPNWIDALNKIYPNVPNLRDTNAVSFNACPSVQGRYLKTSYVSDYWGYTVNTWWHNDGPFQRNDNQKWLGIRHPSSYPWFMDPEMYAWGQGYAGAHCVPLNNPDLSHLGVGPNHNDDRNANVSYADGSVRQISIEEVDKNTNAPNDYGWFENR